jgi:hypothetical protein
MQRLLLSRSCSRVPEFGLWVSGCTMLFLFRNVGLLSLAELLLEEGDDRGSLRGEHIILLDLLDRLPALLVLLVFEVY